MARTKGAYSAKYAPDLMAEAVESYLAECLKRRKVPIFKEVTVKQNWTYMNAERLRSKEGYEAYAEAVNKLFDAKEYMLERLGLDGKVDKTMAIFSLKQLGWKDQQSMEIGASKDNQINITLKVAE
jgi:hypothetical protein